MVNDILETADGFRLRLEIEDGPVNPRRDYDHLVNVITPKGQRYIDVDEDGGPLRYGWDHFSARANGAELFIRWARIMHGAVAVEDKPTEGAWAIWYLMPAKAKESTRPPEKVIDAEIREYRSWAEGDVWNYVIEKRVEWEPAEKNGDAEKTMITWEIEESVSGFIGREYAEQEARGAFSDFLSH